MKLSKILLFLILALLAGCGGGGGGGGGNTTHPTLVSLALAPLNPFVASGSQLQFTATGTYSDNSTQNLTTSATWSSSATSVATISNNGLATAVAAGTTTITAASGLVSSPPTTMAVTRAAPTLISIAVAPSNPSIASGAQLQFTATGTYSDNSTQNLTTSATWSSSATSVATISNNGLATAVAAGTTTITAASGLVSSSTTMTVPQASNVLSVTVNGALCSAATSSSYLNKPCVSVTVCAPGTSNCQTINDILLDTGSYGLRIFRQAVTLAVLPAATGTLAECIQFGDLTSVWGPVQTADVILGTEKASQVPIQVIDSTFGRSTLRSVCGNAQPDPVSAHYTGILGVGPFVQDCGTACASSARNGRYFSCNGTTNCTGAAVPLTSQVQNPVALLPQNNNGVIVQLPIVPANGAPSVSGSLVLGLGTNVPSLVKSYSIDQFAQFSTQFNEQNYSSFLDTGSNGYFFTPPASSPLPTCGSWFCPASPVDLSVTNTAASGAPSSVVNFRIGNFTSLTSNTANNVFAEIGGTFAVSFDWGLPFFFGKSVYVGFEGKTSATLGTGPYWAY